MQYFLVPTLVLLLPVVQAQQTLYGQCGGIGWTGSTVCVASATCSTQNSYYAQCTPAAVATTKSVTTTLVTLTTSKTPTTGVTSTTSKASTPSVTSTKTSSGTSATTTAPAAGNPYAGYQLYKNAEYSSEVYASAIPSLTGTLLAAASAAAEVPSFLWLDTTAKVPLMGTYLQSIKALNAAGANPPYAGQFVVYDLPDRDCSAAASNGEFTIADNGVANYFAYIDSIRALLVTYSDVHTILVIEPDSLANLITNLNVAKCAGAQSAYMQCVNYALTQLNLPNVAMYIDAGHAGWLGWSANIGPAANLFATVYKNAGAPASLRGLATNVANYNAWTISPCPSYTSGDANCDEQLYVNALAPLLASQGWSAHFITDTGRNGVQPTAQNAWGDWCNLIGTGFGVRPTTNTGDALEDAFVWVKPGGEADGSSNSTAPRYDYHCGSSDALQPAPQAGTWFEAYFVQLLTNANPKF
ncbi:putative 1,4-beta-D-glucan cellobiohydrolase C [Hyaloscypha finlandica]|nr:putative 1,4-beta-D-glucan cellobiohydrolase C [Hyaloscypha finlandica]